MQRQSHSGVILVSLLLGALWVSSICRGADLEAADEAPGAEVEQAADAVVGDGRNQGPVRRHRQGVDLAAAAGDRLRRAAAGNGRDGLQGRRQPLLARCCTLLLVKDVSSSIGCATCGRSVLSSGSVRFSSTVW